ncbi:mucin-17-like [Pseudomyrmex gracilis]|uniref:mucin-17-like n=1 Tax=Pseudomyrmex gracilis TaxID=219809 RepID=UPI000995C688|nr:mucin-17-like [Pseudomyrmex gracilis]
MFADAPVGDAHRRARTSSSHAELSKAKREQALRNLLARRRQILNQRVHESSPRIASSRAPRPGDATSKDPPDILETQETRHSDYVTSARTETTGEEKTPPRKSVEKMIETESQTPRTGSKIEVSTSESSTLSPIVVSNGQKSGDAETRKKNTVSMPESLYNHFRPVESNIPVEDMSQFLYFGQKLHPDAHNITGSNNSVETTSSISVPTSSRRRYSAKRFSATIAAPAEEIVNDEMNIAVDRRTVEKNQVSRIKNTFRSPGNGLYYRKTRPTADVASNVIPSNESSGDRRGDSSAHAETQDRTLRERGVAAHVVDAGTTTQISRRRDDAESETADDEKLSNETVASGESLRKMTNDFVEETNVGKKIEADKVVDSKSLTKSSESRPTTTSVEKVRTRSRESSIVETSSSPRPTESSTTLRIVVPDDSPLALPSFATENDRTHNTVKQPVSADSVADRRPVRDDKAPKSSSTTSLTTELSLSATTGVSNWQRPQPQQQHVYAYTITNVTRLLRNYTGPGIEPARTPAGLSTGATVEPVAVAEASPTVVVDGLVGERSRKVALPQQQRASGQRAAAAATNDSVISPTRPVKSAEPGSGEPVRWNQAKSRSGVEQEGANDRRFLRKSASAVLNQRSNVNEESSVVNNKRRRVLAPQSGLKSPSSRRLKSGENREKDRVKERVSVVNEVRSLNGTVGDRGRINSDNEAPSVGSLREVARAVNEVPGDSSPSESVVMGKLSRNSSAETMDDLSVDDVTTTETVDVKSDVYVAEDVVTASTVMSDGDNVGTEDNQDVAKTDANVTDGVTAAATTVTVNEQLEETVATTASGATPAAPVFPVTPRILTEAERTTVDGSETFTLRPTDVAKAPEPNNLDPSEIQKRYRAKDATTTSTTTTTTTASPIRDDTRPADDASSDKKSEVSPVTENGKRISGERSPEVRARNLSDKSKDKDDVLPIMHLYNTSDIFNGSDRMDGFARGTERPRVVLPVENPVKEEDLSPLTTTEKTPEPTVVSTTEIGGSTSTTVPVLKSKEPTVTPNSRKNKHEENRENTTTAAPTTFSRGSSFAPVAANRTRYRPAYHHSTLPEYNGTIYHPAGPNRTFFETGGPISVSQRESMMNVSDVILKRHDGDAIATQETVAVVTYILATLVVFPIAVGVGLILRRLILRNRKVLEESDTSSEISCRKDALNLENGDFKTSIEKAITKLPRIQHLCHEAEKPPPPPSQESRWEFPRDKLRLQTVLGQGNFGQVWKAEADDLTGHQGTTRLVAVKTVKEGASDREKEDLDRELEIMKQLGSHPNVVTLLGCCTEEEPHYLILEYVMYGKLLAYLRDHRTRQYFYNFSEDSAALTSRDLTVFGYCVARGMEYLASKKIIHRDLAARNVLVDHNKLCKIADFGMSRFANEDGEVIETRHGRNALPIRWMAPESLIYSLFTTKTDVWSFGILMWEIVTLGSTPYPDMTAREVMRNVHNGYRLERPSHCRSELFRVISRCWHADPDRRPEFQTLRRDLAQLLEDNMNGHYVDLESFASECTD